MTKPLKTWIVRFASSRAMASTKRVLAFDSTCMTWTEQSKIALRRSHYNQRTRELLKIGP